MRKVALISSCLALAGSLLVLTGCSGPSSSGPTEKIDGMSPAEYREKAEMRREIPAPGPKTGSGSQRP
jgi:hypothetical protein